MDRTYNVFVDNGLFVLANYLDKEVEAITIEDIVNEDIVNHFAQLFDKVYETEKYRTLAFASFQNSSYTQPLQKDPDRKTKVEKQYKTILDNIGEGDICAICGKNDVSQYEKEFIKSLSKSLMPRLASNTFFNYSNNLKKQNVCPICLYLSMLSFFNMKSVVGQCVLFDSDDDEFMYDYTYEHKVEIDNDTLINAKKYKSDKKNKRTFNGEIAELIVNKINNNKIYDGYIEIVKFYNSSQGESYETELLGKKDINFLKELQLASLLQEFKEKWLFGKLLNGTLQRNYLKYIFDFKENILKISKELFCKIEEEYIKMKKEKLELIKRVSKQVYNSKIKDVTKDLKGIDKLSQFEKMIMSWIETIPNLMTTDEFDSLCNIKEFSSVKNRMYVELINLKNEGEI